MVRIVAKTSVFLAHDDSVALEAETGMVRHVGLGARIHHPINKVLPHKHLLVEGGLLLLSLRLHLIGALADDGEGGERVDDVLVVFSTHLLPYSHLILE